MSLRAQPHEVYSSFAIGTLHNHCSLRHHLNKAPRDTFLSPLTATRNCAKEVAGLVPSNISNENINENVFLYGLILRKLRAKCEFQAQLLMAIFLNFYFLKYFYINLVRILFCFILSHLRLFSERGRV